MISRLVTWLFGQHDEVQMPPLRDMYSERTDFNKRQEHEDEMLAEIDKHLNNARTALRAAERRRAPRDA